MFLLAMTFFQPDSLSDEITYWILNVVYQAILSRNITWFIKWRNVSDVLNFFSCDLTPDSQGCLTRPKEKCTLQGGENLLLNCLVVVLSCNVLNLKFEQAMKCFFGLKNMIKQEKYLCILIFLQEGGVTFPFSLLITK